MRKYLLMKLCEILMNIDHIIHEYSNGKSLSKIEKEIGISRHIITKILKENNVKINHKPQKVELVLDKEIFQREFLTSSSNEECCKKLNITPSILYKYQKMYNVYRDKIEIDLNLLYTEYGIVGKNFGFIRI